MYILNRTMINGKSSRFSISLRTQSLRPHTNETNGNGTKETEK